jgi:bifunctional non-homologous end joining protein LigD
MPTPVSLEPQLATLVREPPVGPGWVFEIKYDGYRALAIVNDGHAELRSRRGLRFGGLDAIRARLGSLRCHDIVLDGELCALDEEGRPRFEALQQALGRREHTIVYFVFDVLVLDGVDLRDEPLTERKKILARVLRTTDEGCVRRVAANRAEGARFLDAMREMGLEGLIAKRADGPYRAGRSLDWLKVKIDRRQELVVVGFTPPSGTRTGLGALLVGFYRAGQLHYAGKVGTGFDEETLASLASRLSRSTVARSPVVDPPRMRDARWVRPELVAEVRFSEWTRDGRLRHPVFLGLRPDKQPREVVREQAIGTIDAA